MFHSNFAIDSTHFYLLLLKKIIRRCYIKIVQHVTQFSNQFVDKNSESILNDVVKYLDLFFFLNKNRMQYGKFKMTGTFCLETSLFIKQTYFGHTNSNSRSQNRIFPS